MGLGERHGGHMKTMVRGIVHETSADGEDEMEIVLLEAAIVKKQLTRTHGFSPIQHVLGQDIRLPASIIDGENELAAHSWAEGDGSCKRRLKMRMAARMAWVRLDNSSRLCRAILRRTRKHRGPWLPGTQVYFWKRAGKSGTKTMKGRRRKEPDRWIGPGVVLQSEGNRAV